MVSESELLVMVLELQEELPETFPVARATAAAGIW